MLSYINWAASPEIFSIGPLTIRWYGLLFASGFLIGQQIIARIFKAEGKPEADLEKLLIYMVVSTVVGARLGHVLFYDPSQYFTSADPFAIFRIWEGGLASHGAAIAIPIGLYLYARKREGQSFLWVVDRIVIVVALGAAFIRMGNLMNSEIIGKPTTASYGVVFSGTYKNGLIDQKFYQREIENINVELTGKDTTVNNKPHTSARVNITFQRRTIDTTTARQYAQKTLVTLNRYSTAAHFKKLQQPVVKVQIKDRKVIAHIDGLYVVPRHAAQFYESISYFLLFWLLIFVYIRRKARTPEGLLFGIFMVGLFSLRIMFEFLKPVQSELIGTGNFFNMGQWLSVPGVIVGFVLLGIAAKNAKKLKEE